MTNQERRLALIEMLKDDLEGARDYYLRDEDREVIVEALKKQAISDYASEWIPCGEALPPQPKENPTFDYKPIELYLVSTNESVYPFRAFWNGKFFTDGFSKQKVLAWMPLPEPYEEGEQE